MITKPFTNKIAFWTIGVWCFLSLLWFNTTIVEAASPSGQFGWYLPFAAVMGNDTICAPDEIRMVLDISVRDSAAESPSVPSALFAVIEGDGSVSEFVDGVGPLLDGICVNPDTQGIAIDIVGGSEYYDFSAVHYFSNPEDIERGKMVSSEVFLTYASYPTPEYEKVAPLTSVSSSSPDYIFDINYIPTDLSLPSVTSIRHQVFEILGSSTTPAINVDVAISGGVGRKTIPALPLTDGVYSWTGAVTATGPVVYDGFGYVTREKAKTGLFDNDGLFVVDSSAPSSTISHFPTSPNNLQTVTLRADAEDSLAGVRKIEIFLDSTLVRTCPFADKNTATCVYTSGLYSGGELHTYDIRIHDAAGNVTSSSSSFITTTSAPVFPNTCTTPLLTVRDAETAVSGTESTELSVLVRSGNLIYAGASGAVNGLFIYDITNPSVIIQRSYFSTDEPFSVRNNWWGNDVVGLTVDGGYAYLVTLYGGLVIVDISNPDSPAFVGKRALHNQNPPDTKETWEVKVSGNYAYVAGGLGMFVVDVSNRANPVVVANLDLGATRATDVTLSGNFAYIALGRYGFSVVDITDPTNPVEVAKVPDVYSPLILAYSVAVKDEYLYVSAHFANRVRVYNITNPASPVYLTSVDVPAPTGGSPRSLLVEGQTLYVSAGTGGAYIFDIANPSAPAFLYSVSASDLAAPVDVWGVLSANGDFKDLVLVSRTPEAALYTTSLECSPIADLEAAMPSISETSIMQGDTVVLRTGDIRNRGTDIAGSHSYGGFYLDYNGDDGTDFTIPIERVINSINPGEEFELTVDWVVPTLVPPGNGYRIRYEVDSEYEVESLGLPLRENNASPWSAPFTILALTQAGTIETTDCTIDPGDSSCMVTVVWEAKNFLGTPSVRQGGEEFSTETSSSSVERAVTPNNRFFSLVDTGSSFIHADAAIVTCAGESVWNGSLCAPAPPTCPTGQFYHTDLAACINYPIVELYQEGVVLNNVLLRQSSSAVLTYSVNAPFDMNCTVFDGTIPAYAFVHTGSVSPVAEGTYSTRPLESAQIIRISCTAPGLPEPQEVEFRINVVPQIVEP